MRKFVNNLTGVQAYRYAKEVHISTPGAIALGELTPEQSQQMMQTIIAITEEV